MATSKSDLTDLHGPDRHSGRCGSMIWKAQALDHPAQGRVLELDVERWHGCILLDGLNATLPEVDRVAVTACMGLVPTVGFPGSVKKVRYP